MSDPRKVAVVGVTGYTGFELARLLLRLDKGQDALHFFQKALEKDPRHRPTHESLAAYFTRAGDLRQAAYHRQQVGQKP